MADYKGGRKWEESNDLTGATGLLNLNSAQKQGIVSSNDALLLFIEVSEISYLDDTGTLQTFNGTVSPVAVPPNEATVFLWIDDNNTLQQSTSSFPAMGSFFIALGIVTTSLTNVLQIINMQQASATVAPGGVNSLGVASPVLNTGTASDPVIDMQPATAAQDGHATAAQITKLDGIETTADVTDTANVAAAGAIMSSLLTADGNLITKSAAALAQIVPGAIGTVLTSAGPGSVPAYQAITSFTPQFLVANSAQGAPSGLLPYSAAKWTQILATGNILVNATNPELIDINEAGTYIAIAMMASRGTNPVHDLQFNSPPNPAVKISAASFSKNRPGVFATGSLNIIGVFTGPQQLALETSGTNFGTNGVDGTDPLENMIIILKVAN